MAKVDPPQTPAENAAVETDPWFVGEFGGAMTLDPDGGRWSLKCDVGKPCALSIQQPAKPVQIISTKVAVRGEAVIPNNNLNGTRQAVRQQPALYEDKRYGGMLVSLRNLLDSQARFERCVEIAVGAEVSLCSISSDPRATSSIVLVIGTMNGQCGTGPFCAYYYQVLLRKIESEQSQ